MCRNIVIDLVQSMALCKIIRILAIRKQDNLHIHSLLEHQTYSPEGRMDSRTVAVIDYSDIVGEFLYQTDLLDREGSTAGSHHVGDSELMHGQDVEVALYQDTFVLPGNFILCEIDSIQGLALYIYLCFRRIDIFGNILVRTQGSAAESDDSSADGMNRENHPVVETVHEPAVIILYGQPRFNKEFFLETGSTGSLRK